MNIFINRIKYLLSKFFKKIRLSSIRKSTIDKKTKIQSGSNIINSHISNYSYLGYDCLVVNCKIGKFCSIADNVKIGAASHPIYWGSSSSVFHNGSNPLKINFSHHNYEPYDKYTLIENDVWIGTNVCIKSGVKISNGAIIGMGSVVTKDVGPYEIWAGNPAKLIKKRFDDITIKRLLDSFWWDSDEKKLKFISEKIYDVNIFLNRCKEYENSTC